LIRTGEAPTLSDPAAAPAGRRPRGAPWALLLAAAWAHAALPQDAPLPAAAAQTEDGQETAVAPPQAPALSPAVLRPRQIGLPPPGPDAGRQRLTGIEAAEVGVLKLWFERGRLLQDGDATGAAVAVRRMQALMDREGIGGMEMLAAAFSHEGYERLRAGDYQLARESFELALRFDPTLPATHYGLADARRLAGEGFVPFVREKVRGARAALGNFWWAYMGMSNALVLMLAALTLTGALFALLMAARYQAAWRHDVMEFLRAREFGDPAARLWGTASFLLPLLLWLGGVWALLYWTAGSFRYQRRAEKALSLGVVLLAIAAVPSVGFLLATYRVTSDETMKATVSALKGGYEPEKARYIQQVLSTRPDDPTFHFLLASILKDGANFDESFQHYKAVLAVDANDYRSYNNIGNIFSAIGDHGQALGWYRKATDANPRFATGFFNAYLAQREQLHFTEADASLDQARALDPDAVGRYLGRAGDEAAASPVDAKIPMWEAWLQTVRGRSAEGSTVGSTGAFARSPLAIAGIACLAMILGRSVLGRGERVRQCPRCGRAFCSRCHRESGTTDQCAQCIQLHLRRDGVAPEVRALKERRVARYARWSRIGTRVAALVLPGSAHLLLGRATLGALLSFSWFALALFLVAGPRLLAYPGAPHVAAAGPTAWLAIAAAAIVWIVGNAFRAWRVVATEA